MYSWVLTLVTLFEPTLIGQLSHSFLITYILEVASNSIALCARPVTRTFLFFSKPAVNRTYMEMDLKLIYTSDCKARFCINLV